MYFFSNICLPSNLTTRGMFNPNFCEAATIPFAIVAQFTIPPNTLTRIDFTFGSEEKKKVYEINNNFSISIHVNFNG